MAACFIFRTWFMLLWCWGCTPKLWGQFDFASYRSHIKPRSALHEIELYRFCQKPLAHAFVNIKMTAFWDISPSSLVGVYRRFSGTSYLHHKGDSLECYHRRLSSSYSPVSTWNLVRFQVLTAASMMNIYNNTYLKTVLMWSIFNDLQGKYFWSLTSANRFATTHFCLPQDRVSWRVLLKTKEPSGSMKGKEFLH
jgi:hypothetical protein